MSGNEYEKAWRHEPETRARTEEREPVTMGAEETMESTPRGEIIGADTTAPTVTERIAMRGRYHCGYFCSSHPQTDLPDTQGRV